MTDARSAHRQGVADALAGFARRVQSGNARGLRIGSDPTPGPLLPLAPARSPHPPHPPRRDLERDVLKAVKRALTASGVKWWRNQVAHADTTAGGRIVIGEPGMPDLMALHADGSGRLVCIELKRPGGGVLSGAQRRWLDEARARGAIAGVARSVADARALVGLA